MLMLMLLMLACTAISLLLIAKPMVQSPGLGLGPDREPMIR